MRVGDTNRKTIARFGVLRDYPYRAKEAASRAVSHTTRLFLVLALMGIAGELFARFALDLGTPPLWVTNDRVEYMFRPNQDLHRFGNRIKINAYGMRSEELPLDDTDKVLVFGDSVLNGEV